MQNEHVQNVLKTTKIFVIILSIFFVVLTIAAIKATGQIGAGAPASNTITLNGEGEVLAVPDIAEFTFSVVEVRDTAEEAQDAASEKSNAILDYLDEQDIDKKDVKTISYNVYPKYEWQTGYIPEKLPLSENQVDIAVVSEPLYYPEGKQVLIGYEVRQSIRVKVRDTDSAGTLLSGVGELGASNISGLTFTIDDEDELQREARQMAIEDAQEKAEDLADDLGVRIVRVVGFSESGIYPFYARGYGEAFDDAVAVEESAVPDIPVGENKIVSNVSITYEIR